MAITKASSSAVAPAAKGDLVAGSATNDAAVLGVGANNTVLTADSAEATGLKWATPSSGSFTQLASANLPTGASTVTISSIYGTYRDFRLLVRDVNVGASQQTRLGFRLNSDTGSNYFVINAFPSTSSGQTSVTRNFNYDENAADVVCQLILLNYSETTTPKFFNRKELVFELSNGGEKIFTENQKIII